MRTLLLYPFLYLTSGIIRKSNKIGGFVVKGNPKIQIQYFQFHGLATIPNKVNIYLHTCNCADRAFYHPTVDAQNKTPPPQKLCRA